MFCLLSVGFKMNILDVKCDFVCCFVCFFLAFCFAYLW